MFSIVFGFLKLDEIGLRDGLLKRTIFAHGEAVVTPLSQEQAFDVRYGDVGDLWIMIWCFFVVF